MEKKISKVRGLKVLWLAVWGALLWSACAVSTSHDEPASPNIILVVADYMGYADIGPYGAQDIATPTLDQLAKQGVRYSNHYTSAPKCIPARASLMSGLYPSKALDYGRGLPAGRNHLLHGLKNRGYRSAMLGKWHLGLQPGYHPLDHGFDFFLGYSSWTLSPHSHETSDGKAGLWRGREEANESGYLSDILSREAVKFVSQSPKEPFFLYLSYRGGLPPYQPAGLAKSEWGSGWDAESSNRDTYVAMIERMDLGIASVMAELESAGIDSNTLVVFTYDHGGRHLTNSGSLFHGFGTLWEGGIRVPLIIRWGNTFYGNKTIAEPSINMDISATILDAIGAQKRIAQTDGRSLMPVVAANRAVRPFFWRTSKMKAVRLGRWKLLIDNHSRFLFDLESDIAERKNLFYQYPGKVAELKILLDEWETSQK